MGATTDRDALAALFRSTGGDTWHRKYGWDTNAELSCWHGVKVNVEGRVVKLSLAKNNLEGTVLECVQNTVALPSARCCNSPTVLDFPLLGGRTEQSCVV